MRIGEQVTHVETVMRLLQFNKNAAAELLSLES